MLIMIDIDDDLYTRLFDNGEDYVMDMRRACAAIRNGKPLPKGHGRLIDADKMKSKMLYSHDIGAEIETNGTEATINYIFDDAPTIIEAESEV